MPRRERGPPCKNPTCSDKTNSSGQWAYLPPAFAEEHGFDKDDCHCHKRPCRRWCGKLGTQLPPGRTAAGAPAKRVRAGDAAIGVALDAADELPRPPILVAIDEIWAVRYAAPAPPPRRMCCCCLCPAVRGSRARPPLPLCVCRYINFELLEPWQRGNALSFEPALEYAVHGKFQRTTDDIKGVHGCWWLSLLELVRTLGEDVVKEAVADFERELVSEREQAMTRVRIELEAEAREAERTEE